MTVAKWIIILGYIVSLIPFTLSSIVYLHTRENRWLELVYRAGWALIVLTLSTIFISIME